MTDMTEKTVLITGASRGIGAAAAHVFADAGAHVMLLARSTDDINRIAGEIGPMARAVACDVSNYADLQNATQIAMDWTGRVDVLINNAGVIEPIGLLTSSEPEAWGKLIDINIKGVYYGVHSVLPIMAAQGQGTIINISSGAAHNALEGWSAYCTSKAGVHMLTRAIHKEHGNRLTVMGLSPGTVATEMQVLIKDSGINPVSQLDPSIHIPADWPARALLWMCGTEAAEHNGTEISLRDEEIRRAVGLI